MKRRTIKKKCLISTIALTTLALRALASPLFAQETGAPAGDAALIRVMWVILAAWAVIAILLFSIDRKVSRMERGRRDG